MKLTNKSNSSHRWLLEHFTDKYVTEAKKNKIRSRSWFKLEELDMHNKLFKIGMNVIDLGASPGGWSQYASSKIGEQGKILACDILPIKPIIGVNFFQGDFLSDNILSKILNFFRNIRCNLVMSDMTPNMTGYCSIDMPRVLNLCRSALKMSELLLCKNGIFLLKSFQGEGFNEFYKEVKILFSKVKICKPKASRTRSREIFILATR